MKISQIQCLSFKQSRWQKSKCDNCLKFHSAEITIDNNNSNSGINNSSNKIEEKKLETIEIVNKENINSNNKEMTIDNNQPDESISSIKNSTTPPPSKPITLQFADCLDFKSNQWRPNVCVTCFLPKNKHANGGISNIIPESTTPLISQSSQTSTITPISSSTSTSTSSISTHKTANNKTVITYISSTTTTTTTSSASSPPSSSISTLSPSSVSSTSRSSSPVLKSVSTVVVPPIVINNKSMSTPGSPLQSRKSSPPIAQPVQQSQQQQPTSMIISSNANNAIRPVLKRQFQSFPSNPKISKAILEECANVDPIILCKYTIESLPKNNISILKPTLVEFINQHDDDDTKDDQQQQQPPTTQPKQPIFNSKQSAIMDGITTHKSVSITISTLKSPSSTTTTTSTTTSIIAEEPSSPILTNNSNNNNKDTTNTIPMSPSLPSIPLHAFENNIENIKNEPILGGGSNNNSRRNSMNPIVPLRLKSFSFSAPQSDSMIEEDDPFFDFEDLSDDEDDQVDQDDNSNSRPNSNINNNNIPTTTITSTTTILQSPTSEKTLSTTTTTSSIPSPTTNSRSFSPLKDSNGVGSQHVEPPLLKVPTNNVSTSTTTTTTSTKRRSIKMDQFKEKEDEWDHGVDLSSFLKRKPTLQRDFSYCNNKFMEITSVKEEAKRLHVGTGYIHQFAFEAFKDILEAKQMQINKAFERQKIDEPDCNMLTEELNSAKMLLDELLELSGNGDISSGSSSGGSSVNGSNSNSPSSSKNNTLNQQSICIKSE